MPDDTSRREEEVRAGDIEQAARKVFLSRGFQAATMQEIAEEAGSRQQKATKTERSRARRPSRRRVEMTKWVAASGSVRGLNVSRITGTRSRDGGPA
jgi:hypothetical protein